MSIIRSIAEGLYNSKCTVTELKSQKGDINNVKPVVVLENIPCRVSYSSLRASGRSDMAAGIEQQVRLFIPPDIDIKAGSRVTVVTNGKSIEYDCSGQCASYDSHKEIYIKLKKEFA